MFPDPISEGPPQTSSRNKLAKTFIPQKEKTKTKMSKQKKKWQLELPRGGGQKEDWVVSGACWTSCPLSRGFQKCCIMDSQPPMCVLENQAAEGQRGHTGFNLAKQNKNPIKKLLLLLVVVGKIPRNFWLEGDNPPWI